MSSKSSHSRQPNQPFSFISISSFCANVLHHPLRSGLFLLVFCGVLFFWQLDGYTLFNNTEAKQAEIARQMWIRRDWITPVYNGELYFDKPVLLHWLIAIGFASLGLHEWAVRLPSAVAATLLVLGTWAFVSHFANRRVGLIAATMVAANPFTFTLGRTGQHDMLLTSFVGLALYCWYFAYSSGKTWSYLVFFACLGLATMSKGPLAIVLVGLTIGVFLIWVGRIWEQVKTIPWLWGGLIFAAITLPWHVLVLQANGWNFINGYVGYSNVDRFVAVNLNQTGPWYYYIPLAIVGLFPWIMLIPSQFRQPLPLRSLLGRTYWQQRSPDQQVSLFMGIWFLAIFLFMSVAATKLPWYIFPGLPALAYLCAQAWEKQITAPDSWLKLELRLIAVVYGLCAIGFVGVPRLFSQEAVVREIVGQGIPWLLGSIYLVAAIAIWMSARSRGVMRAWLISLITFSSFALIVVHLLLPILDRQVLGGRLLGITAALQQETCDTCSEDFPATLGIGSPSVNFYSQISYIKRFEGIQAGADLLVQLQQPQRLLLITTNAALQSIGLDLHPYRPTYVSGKNLLYIIQPDRDESEAIPR
ncbi:MAG TPA: glycosyltransferase family 39 protein [Trichocoleus sp.]|jgi:4-amino-4-deoxy-L-arabinose transferase-like glycosyltransferase